MQTAVFTESDLHTDEEYVIAVEVLQQTLTRCALDWGVPAPAIVYYGKPTAIRNTRAATVVASMPEAPDAEAYHTDDAGNIYSKILDDPDFDVVTVGLDHENKEELLDAEANLSRAMPDGRLLAFEICDPVQGDTRKVSFTIAGVTREIAISNYVLPAYFEDGSEGPWDAFGLCKGPFEVRPGGYQEIIDPNGGESTYVFGDEKAAQSIEAKRANPYSRLARRAARRAANMVVIDTPEGTEPPAEVTSE